MNCSKDAVLDALTDFANQKPAEIPSVLDEYLSHIARTGDTLFSWQKLRPLLCRKLELVMNEFHKASPTVDLPALPNVEAFKYEEMREKVLEAINCFNSAPFTIQRLCELVVDPRKHYRRTDKFMRGVEKNVLVVSTVEPRSLAQQQQQANASATPMVNGIPGTDDGGINGHFADTTEESLGCLDRENGHCEDEGICADDPGTNVDIPAVSATTATTEATTSSTSSGEEPQPVTEEVAEEQEPKVVASSAEQPKAESSASGGSGEAKEVVNGEAREEAKGEAKGEASGEASEKASEDASGEATAEEEQLAQVEKEAPQELSEAAAPSEVPPAESTTESSSVPSAEGKSTAAPSESVEGAPSEEEAEAAVCDKDTPEPAAGVPGEADLKDSSGKEAEPAVAPEDRNDDDDAEKLPSQSAPDLSEADAAPPPVNAAESKPADPVATSEVTSGSNSCGSSIPAEAPCTDDDLEEPPLKKFHAEPEEVCCTEEAAAEEQPSSTSVFMEDNLEADEAMSQESADASKSEDPVEAMDTAADSSADKGMQPDEPAVDESAMEEN